MPFAARLVALPQSDRGALRPDDCVFGHDPSRPQRVQYVSKRFVGDRVGHGGSSWPTMIRWPSIVLNPNSRMPQGLVRELLYELDASAAGALKVRRHIVNDQVSEVRVVTELLRWQCIRALTGHDSALAVDE